MSDSTQSLINMFEVQMGGAIRHLVCFIDPVLATARGIDGSAVLGEYTPGPGGAFDPQTFQPNPQFIAAFQRFMNEQVAGSPELASEARKNPGGRLHIVDARHQANPDGEPPASELIGLFTIDESGQIVPGSFRHNQAHLWFNSETGGSSVLANRQFYDWLHRASNDAGDLASRARRRSLSDAYRPDFPAGDLTGFDRRRDGRVRCDGDDRR